MERANAGLHESYVKAIQEVTRTKKKRAEVALKSEEKFKTAIDRVKVRVVSVIYCLLYVTNSLYGSGQVRAGSKNRIGKDRTRKRKRNDINCK